eukprot:TRINITY_DN2501_c0_g1_i1.p1 TRINITY_DN2501_c0_g1~~TRINITY_DN2501_c0_g1_i1.p1  ORF type:complete len:540 (+),score=155.74 TRINITY_DN2501_c0_g1_i1:819-2438(+)
MLRDLGLYATAFEPKFLETTDAFFAADAETALSELDVSGYLLHVEQRISHEMTRLALYLEPSTRRPLLTIVDRNLLATHTERIKDKGFELLIEQNKTEDLGRFFQLFNRVNALLLLRTAFGAYIKRVGIVLVSDEERDADLVQILIDFRQKMVDIVTKSFDSQSQFFSVLKESFESFINTRQNKPAELVAKFLDQKLKAGNKESSDAELEHSLDCALVLFRYIHGKDIFEAFYKKDLAKRLLLGRSASFDHEKMMIYKLKSECGHSFTQKLEGMFKDMEISSEIVAAFRQSARVKQQIHKVDVDVHVLTQGYWPPYPPVEIKYPEQLAHVHEVFREFYLSKHNGRRLIWQHTLGHCTVWANFPSGQRELDVSLFQTLVLLLFNDHTKIPFLDILAATGIEISELKRTLQSLACGKVRVLIKEPKGKDVENSDSFLFDENFSHKMRKIKINQIQMKETAEENQATNERVFQDRQYQIDAAVVRIMKARKTLSHTLLVAQLLSHLKFDLKPADAKKRIESLIEREYLERDKENPSLYHYLA